MGRQHLRTVWCSIGIQKRCSCWAKDQSLQGKYWISHQVPTRIKENWKRAQWKNFDSVYQLVQKYRWGIEQTDARCKKRWADQPVKFVQLALWLSWCICGHFRSGVQLKGKKAVADAKEFAEKGRGATSSPPFIPRKTVIPVKKVTPPYQQKGPARNPPRISTIRQRLQDLLRINDLRHL